jgi:hypothetical protein
MQRGSRPVERRSQQRSGKRGKRQWTVDRESGGRTVEPFAAAIVNRLVQREGWRS